MNSHVHTRDYYIVNMTSLPLDVVQTYWQTLGMHDRLAARLCDIDDPQWEDVLDMIRRMGRTMFACVDKDSFIWGEFMLENFTGAKNCRIALHYTLHIGPDSSRAFRPARCSDFKVFSKASTFIPSTSSGIGLNSHWWSSCIMRNAR